MSVSIGQIGEERATLYLQEHGVHIVARNYRTRRGELDIVAQDGDTLCFVEVRLRTENSFGSPLETVVARKQRRLVYAAMEYLARHSRSMNKYACRFDVIAVERTPMRITWIKNAFDLNASMFVLGNAGIRS
jgi:putative endonuclease